MTEDSKTSVEADDSVDEVGRADDGEDEDLIDEVTEVAFAVEVSSGSDRLVTSSVGWVDSSAATATTGEPSSRAARMPRDA